MEKWIVSHGNCYRNTTNKVLVDRARTRYNKYLKLKSIKAWTMMVVPPRVVRPNKRKTTSYEEDSSTKKALFHIIR